jgi:hypothetical protein
MDMRFRFSEVRFLFCDLRFRFGEVRFIEFATKIALEIF